MENPAIESITAGIKTRLNFSAQHDVSDSFVSVSVNSTNETITNKESCDNFAAITVQIKGALNMKYSQFVVCSKELLEVIYRRLP
jgi:hypothetical protein